MIVVNVVDIELLLFFFNLSPNVLAISCVNLLICAFFFQWGAVYCVRGGPEKEKKAMEVCELFFNDLS